MTPNETPTHVNQSPRKCEDGFSTKERGMQDIGFHIPYDSKSRYKCFKN